MNISDPKWRKEEFRQLSWKEYGRTLQILHEKVDKYLKDSNVKIDAVVPILRGVACAGVSSFKKEK